MAQAAEFAQTVLFLASEQASLIPGTGASLAVGVRRLHDIGRSGWWMLIGLVPVVGGIVLLAFFVQDSHAGTNEYGPKPKELV